MNGFVYFDHNVLNRMVRGQEKNIRNEYESLNLCPVYSDVNLDEIQRSEKRKDEFLTLLQRMGARYLNTPMDDNFNSIEKFVVEICDPRERLISLMEARAGYDESNSLDFMSVIYGGGDGRSPSEILLRDLDEAEVNFQELLLETDATDYQSIELRMQATDGLSKIQVLRESLKVDFQELDELAKNGAISQQAAEDTGVGPMQLNNIDMPGAIKKIWRVVKPAYAPLMDTIDEFLSKALSFNSDGPNTQPEIVSRANGLYNLLNYFGYWRDDNLNKSDRMRASFNDMTHVGYAIVCSRMYCGDKRMIKKARAIYEYIDIGTEIKSADGNK